MVDAMTGQEAVNVAIAFNERVPLSGIVLTKLDGDSRGGAALSIGAATGIPVKLAGVGERIQDLEQFDPQRMAQRILGMGDVQGLVERIQEAVDDREIEKIAASVKKKKMTLETCSSRSGRSEDEPLDKVLEMIPGAGKIKGAETHSWTLGDSPTWRPSSSMTREERQNPISSRGAGGGGSPRDRGVPCRRSTGPQAVRADEPDDEAFRPGEDEVPEGVSPSPCEVNRLFVEIQVKSLPGPDGTGRPGNARDGSQNPPCKFGRKKRPLPPRRRRFEERRGTARSSNRSAPMTPMTEPAAMKVRRRGPFTGWVGALPSDTARAILKKTGVWDKFSSGKKQ